VLTVFQNIESGRYYSKEDPKIFAAVIHHMYGASLEDVARCCCLTVLSGLFAELISIQPNLNRTKTDVLDAINTMLRGAKSRLRRDPTPDFAQLMSVFCKQLCRLYVAADQYGLEDLKTQLVDFIKVAISTTRNHSAILDNFKLSCLMIRERKTCSVSG